MLRIAVVGHEQSRLSTFMLEIMFSLVLVPESLDSPDQAPSEWETARSAPKPHGTYLIRGVLERSPRLNYLFNIVHELVACVLPSTRMR